MSWIWDERKAEANLKKHKVSFALAQRVFGDPYHLTRLDPYEGEARWQTIGMPFSDHPGVLFVVHTDDDNGGGRIISARRALAHERRAYEEGEF